MSSRVTQCPKCQTSFRVTDAQLDIANGAVRCGSCLHIFNAPDHWLGETSAPLAASYQHSPQEPPPSPDDSFDDLDDDDFLIGDDLDTDQLFADDDEAENLAEAAEAKEEDDGDELIFDDTSQQNLLETNDDELFSEQTFDLETNLSDSFLDMDSWESSPSAVFKDLNDGDEDEDDGDDWAEKLLEEAENEPAPEPRPAFDLHPDMLEESIASVDGPELDPDLVALLNEAPENDYDLHSQSLTGEHSAISQQVLASEQDFNAGDRIGTANAYNKPLLSNIEPEPVEMAGGTTSKSGYRWLWRAAILLAALGLPAQYIHYNFDSLSRDSQYRPLFKSLCQLSGCKLPTLYDIGLIRSSNLMVRSHPSAENALVVDAMMTNLANFQQPFPLLELQFTDIDGQIIAGRRFTPSDYLAGELTGSTRMPAKQPIHISLAIIDPGSAAVNYQLRFLPQ
ncbi:DUF3426 domain-containing protein [Dasania marina]|uniref:DUF3426 domain-containing protein n=1 Tax=Dasania marina TaxID=471499 RepID=UPI0030D7007E